MKITEKKQTEKLLKKKKTILNYNKNTLDY